MSEPAPLGHRARRILNARKFELDVAPQRVEVLRLRASQGEPAEPHYVWNVGVAQDVFGTDKDRIVIATLHAGGSAGWGDITVGCSLPKTARLRTEAELASVLAGSAVLETLYAFARTHLLPLLATVNADVDLPREAPEPKIQPLTRSSRNERSDGIPST